MKIVIFLVACLLPASAFASQAVYLQCSIPSSSGSYDGADGKKVVTHTPAVDLQITVNKDTSQISQLFKSGDDTYSFTTKGQFTPTNILYKWTRRHGFIRTDNFNIDRKTLMVTFTVEYPRMGSLAPRQGFCKIVPQPHTQI